MAEGKKGTGKPAAKQSAKKKEEPKKEESIVESITELVRTSVFAGLGLAFLGEEKLEKWVKDVAKKNNLSTNDMKSFMSDLRSEGMKARGELEKRVKKLIKDITPSDKKKG